MRTMPGATHLPASDPSVQSVPTNEEVTRCGEDMPNDPDPHENRMTDEYREAFWLRMGRPDIAAVFVVQSKTGGA